jgi:hypothetical protein
MISSLGRLESEELGSEMQLRFEELLARGFHECRVMRGKDERLAFMRRSGFEAFELKDRVLHFD